MGTNWYEVFGWVFPACFPCTLDLPLCCTLPFMSTSLKDTAIAHEEHVLGGTRGMFSFKAKRMPVDIVLDLFPL